MKQWMTPDDVEQEFGIKKSTQNAWRHQKKIPYSKMGKFVYYSREKLYAMLDRQAVTSC